MSSPCMPNYVVIVCVLVIPVVEFLFGFVVARQNSISQSGAICFHSEDVFFGDKKLLKIVGILDREVTENIKGTLLYIYEDGVTEKKIILE